MENIANKENVKFWNAFFSENDKPKPGISNQKKEIIPVKRLTAHCQKFSP